MYFSYTAHLVAGLSQNPTLILVHVDPTYYLPLLSMPLSHTAHLSYCFLSPEANPSQNEKKTNLLGRFFERGRSNDEMAEENRTANEKKATFKRKYQESYLNYRFIATGSPNSSSLLCTICSGWISKEAMKPSKLLCHMETEYSALKDKALEFFKRKKKCEHEEQKQLLKATTSSNVSALRASFLVAKAMRPFTIGEELIMPAAKDICHEFWGEAAVQNMAHIPLHLAP